MKKIIIIITIITTFLLSISTVYALDISVKEIKILDKNDNISIDSITSDNLTIIPKITFNEVNDYVIYKVFFKGKDISNYEVLKISDNNASENIKTTYKYDKTLESPLYITMAYKNGSDKETTINNINIIMELVGNGETEQIILNSSSNEEQKDVDKSADTGTLSHIITPIILIVISVFLINYYTKNKDENTLMILILFLITIPITVIAYESQKLTLTIKTDKIIVAKSETKQTYKVYLYPNGGTGISEGQIFEYEGKTEFDKFPKVSKDKCTLSGWNVGSPDGEKYYNYIDETDDGQKLYARWNCNYNDNQDYIIANYKTSSAATLDLSDLGCVYKNSLLNPITKTYANSLIEPRLKSGLQQICTYLKNNQNIYKSTEILSAGIYAETDMYPHQWGMGIDLFSAWEYTYNGKTYMPYAIFHGGKEPYQKFICEVCNGDYTCKENLNYQIYEQILKPLGFCWGGYWKEQYFDPMHFEYDIKNGNCSSSPQITINCS